MGRGASGDCATPLRSGELDQAKAPERADADGAEDLKGKYFGTIGAVALDAEGRIATATSTGGMTNKRWGRVGDTPLVGAGTWADERCGVSGTGWGEFFRSEEHTSELQSLMRISYAVFCLKKKKTRH